MNYLKRKTQQQPHFRLKLILKQFIFPFIPSRVDGQSDVEVQLKAKKFIERGGSLTLTCKHNVPLEKIYKVTWLKGNGKIFEYINGREPPYRNFTVPGAEIDVRIFFSLHLFRVM